MVVPGSVLLFAAVRWWVLRAVQLSVASNMMRSHDDCWFRLRYLTHLYPISFS
jgi:hypothetical protein